ncbi:hypothetical protein EZV62_027488 [Acer yangbiense]|uniref:Uncharacterized protein n=1 Tax=Acer yangbiense TaxID=1000413 RepID=A0A5C7GTS8_9ROSI|nr:hypothetical protein EZV62_027488 [Acer yangbiense]
MNEIASTETPFPHKAGNLYKIQYSVNWVEPGAESDKNSISWSHDFLHEFQKKNPDTSIKAVRPLVDVINQLSSRCGAILQDIESLRLFRKDPTIIWSSVSSNKVALALTKEALKLVEDNFWIEDFPQNVREEVETDMLI